MQSDLMHFASRIFDGYPILFLGSGFSAHSLNRQNESLPTGGSLARLLKTKLEFSSDYPLDVLSREYIAKFGETGLLTLLQEKLTAIAVSPDQESMIGLPWRRIYTTNYDNVVELAARKAPRKIVPTTLRDHVDTNRSLTQCVHLNGRLSSVDIRTFQNDIKLTRASYLTDTFLDTPWSATFKNDLALATAVLFVGYSMYDLDIARIVYEDPILRSKTCFIDTPELDPVFARELSQYGDVFPVGVSGFIAELAGVTIPAASRDSFTAFEKYTPPSAVAEI